MTHNIYEMSDDLFRYFTEYIDEVLALRNDDNKVTLYVFKNKICFFISYNHQYRVEIEIIQNNEKINTFEVYQIKFSAETTEKNVINILL